MNAHACTRGGLRTWAVCMVFTQHTETAQDTLTRAHMFQGCTSQDRGVERSWEGVWGGRRCGLRCGRHGTLPPPVVIAFSGGGPGGCSSDDPGLPTHPSLGTPGCCSISPLGAEGIGSGRNCSFVSSGLGSRSECRPESMGDTDMTSEISLQPQGKGA